MFASLPVRMLVIGAALQLCAAASFAQASGISCAILNDGTRWDMEDSLDDLSVGKLDAPLTRSCAADSQWPTGTYTVAASRGALRVTESLGSGDGRSLMPLDRRAGVVFDHFAPDANSFTLVIHGADKHGKYVKNTKMDLLVTAVDGTILWSTTLRINGRAYPLGLSGSTPIATVQLQLSANQPDGVENSFPVIDSFSTAHDSSFGGQQALEPQRVMGMK